MVLRKRGGYWYGAGPEDTRVELQRYSNLNGYRAVRFAEPVCRCGSRSFRLATDEDEGAARRTCTICGATHFMGDSARYAAIAEFTDHGCICSGNEFELLCGVAVYRDSNDVRWFYIGCRCTVCGLVGVFADWKWEAGDADVFLSGI